MTTAGDPLAALDPYELRHLATHLLAAGRAADLDRLLALDVTVPAEWEPGGLWTRLRLRAASQSRNAWYLAHLAAGDAVDYLADLTLARQTAAADWQAELAAGGQAASLGREVRYALLQASITGQQRKLPAALIVALVTGGLWTHADGLRRAATLPLADRTEVLVSLLDGLPEAEWWPLVEAELTTANSESNTDPDRAQALRLLAPHLPEPLKQEALAAALAANRRLRTDAERVAELVALAEHLTPALAQRAVASTEEFGDLADRADALAALVPFLEGAGRLEAVVTIMDMPRREPGRSGLDGMRRRLRRAVAEARLTPYVPEEVAAVLTQSAWHAANEAAPGWERWLVAGNLVDEDVHPLLAVAPHLGPEYRQQALRHVIVHTVRTKKPAIRARLYGQLLPLLAEQGRAYFTDRMLADIRRIRRRRQRLDLIIPLLPYLSGTIRDDLGEEALDLAVTWAGYQPGMVDRLTRLAPHLSRRALLAALSAPWHLRDRIEAPRALVALLPFLPQREQAPTVTTVTEILDRLDENDRARGWIDVVDRAAEPWRAIFVDGALTALRTRTNRQDQVRALGWLLEVTDGADRDRVAKELRWAARLVLGKRGRRAAKTAVAEAAGTTRTDLTRLTYAEATAMPVESDRANALAKLVPGLEPDLTADLLRQVRRMEEPFYRLLVLRPLIPRLTGPLRDELAAAALTDLRRGQTWRAMEALTELAEHLPPALLPEALRLAAEGGRGRADALAALAPHLPDELLEDAVTAVNSLDAAERAPILALLIGRLPAARRGELVEATLAAVDRPIACAPLVRWMPDAIRDELLRGAVATVERLDHDTLYELGPYLPDDLVRGLDTDRLLALSPFNDYAWRLLVPDPSVDVEPAWAEAPSALVAVAATFAGRTAALPAGLRASLARSMLLGGPSRRDLLQSIALLAPVLAELGGDATMIALRDAIDDVARWWR